MNEKPQKRLVGLIEYLETVGEKALGYACGGTLASVSIVLLLWSVFGIIVGAIHIYSRNLEYAIFYWAGSAVVAGMGMVARWFAKALFKEAKKPRLSCFVQRLHRIDFQMRRPLYAL